VWSHHVLMRCEGLAGWKLCISRYGTLRRTKTRRCAAVSLSSFDTSHRVAGVEVRRPTGGNTAEPAYLGLELARRHTARIADLFGFQALARAHREKLVLRIDLQCVVRAAPDWR